jgi:hypothetical protein
MRTFFPLKSTVSLGVYCTRGFALLMILAAALCAAQTPATMTPAATASLARTHKQTHPHKRPATAKEKALAAQLAAQAAAAPATPPAPEVPKWPANEKPTAAKVTWDSHGLRIEAANSSLSQILEDVAAATGTTVEGFNTDQRIYGVYGPGPAREVLSQLLQGTGYNVVMVGDQGQGTPREIVLSIRHAGTATAAASSPVTSDNDDDAEDQPQPGQPATRPAFGPGGPPHTPQQMQQIQQMQQRQPPGQPPSNPQN